MNPLPTSPVPRSRFDGALQIVRYNWPQYAGSVAVVAVALWWLARNPQGASVLRAVAWAAALLSAWWVLASLAASHWIYDCSPLYRWTWIPDFLPAAPKRWLNLHAGLDESFATLAQLFPASSGQVGDFYVAGEMSEPSIQRAREEQQNAAPGMRVDPLQLPFTDQSFDTVFLLFAAHELRRAASREAFLREVRRVLAPGGTVLLVEHVRDLANFVAFGPGFWHFLPSAEWRRLAGVAELELVSERRMTPFVKVMLWRKKP
jgi:SAM-dependent methyltransferase